MPPIPTAQKNPKDTSQLGKFDDLGKNPFVQSLSKERKTQLSIGFVNDIYAAVLKRGPSQRERLGKVNVLVQGGTREGVYRSLVLSREYRQYESREQPLSEQNQKMALSYFQDYLNSQVKAEKLKILNFYTLKRVLTESSLEVMDSFSSRKEVNSWFAILSEHFEKKATWKQKHRQLKTRQRYFRWAEKMPMDIVKSEVIVKLHLLLNTLQLTKSGQ